MCICSIYYTSWNLYLYPFVLFYKYNVIIFVNFTNVYPFTFVNIQYTCITVYICEKLDFAPIEQTRPLAYYNTFYAFFIALRLFFASAYTSPLCDLFLNIFFHHQIRFSKKSRYSV